MRRPLLIYLETNNIKYNLVLKKSDKTRQKLKQKKKISNAVLEWFVSDLFLIVHYILVLQIKSTAYK